MSKFMIWAIGSAASAAAAIAGPQDASLWVGLDGRNGVLIDETSGDAWLTGACLKPLAPAKREGTVWRSHTLDLVSVGRSQVLLDQTFLVETATGRSSITVESAGRGGVQTFSATVDRNCRRSAACRARASTPLC